MRDDTHVSWFGDHHQPHRYTQTHTVYSQNLTHVTSSAGAIRGYAQWREHLPHVGESLSKPRSPSKTCQTQNTISGYVPKLTWNRADNTGLFYQHWH